MPRYERVKRGKYRVPVPPHWSALGYVTRPTRNAAGMTATAARSGHALVADALRLAVFGTLDRVGAKYRARVRPVTVTRYRLRR